MLLDLSLVYTRIHSSCQAFAVVAPQNATTLSSSNDSSQTHQRNIIQRRQCVMEQLYTRRTRMEARANKWEGLSQLSSLESASPRTADYIRHAALSGRLSGDQYPARRHVNGAFPGRYGASSVSIRAKTRKISNDDDRSKARKRLWRLKTNEKKEWTSSCERTRHSQVLPSERTRQQLTMPWVTGNVEPSGQLWELKRPPRAGSAEWTALFRLRKVFLRKGLRCLLLFILTQLNQGNYMNPALHH